METIVINSNERNTKLKTIETVLKKTTLITVVKKTPAPLTRAPRVQTQKIRTNETTENQDLSTHPVRLVVKTTSPQKNATWEQMQQKDRLPGTDDRKAKSSPKKRHSEFK